MSPWCLLRVTTTALAGRLFPSQIHSKFGAVASQPWIWSSPPDILTHSSRHVEGQFLQEHTFCCYIKLPTFSNSTGVRKWYSAQAHSILLSRNAEPHLLVKASCSSPTATLIPDNVGCCESRACINLPDSSICLGSAEQGWDFISIIPVFCATPPRRHPPYCSPWFAAAWVCCWLRAAASLAHWPLTPGLCPIVCMHLIHLSVVDQPVSFSSLLYVKAHCRWQKWSIWGFLPILHLLQL